MNRFLLIFLIVAVGAISNLNAKTIAKKLPYIGNINGVIQTENGTSLLAGSKFKKSVLWGTVASTGIIAKLDANFDTLWVKQFPGYDIQKFDTINNEIVFIAKAIIGNSQAPDSTALHIFHLTQSGNFVSSKKIKTLNKSWEVKDFHYSRVIEQYEIVGYGGYVSGPYPFLKTFTTTKEGVVTNEHTMSNFESYGGSMYSARNGSGQWVMATGIFTLDLYNFSSTGDIIWKRKVPAYYPTYSPVGFVISPTDNGYLIFNYKTVIKINVDGDTLWSRPIENGSAAYSVAVFMSNDTINAISSSAHTLIDKDKKVTMYPLSFPGLSDPEVARAFKSYTPLGNNNFAYWGSSVNEAANAEEPYGILLAGNLFDMTTTGANDPLLSSIDNPYIYHQPGSDKLEVVTVKEVQQVILYDLNGNKTSYPSKEVYTAKKGLQIVSVLFSDGSSQRFKTILD